MNDLVSIIFIRVCCNRGARIVVCVFTVTNIRIAADEKSKMRSKNVRTGISSRDYYTHGSAAAAAWQSAVRRHGHRAKRRRRSRSRNPCGGAGLASVRPYVSRTLGGPKWCARGTPCVYY